MIFGLIIILAFIIFMAIFIGLNLSNTCNFWFFNHFENIPVAVLALIAFAAGIVFSLLCMIVKKLTSDDSSSKKKKLTDEKIDKKKSLLKKAEKAAKKDKLAKEKEKNAENKNSDETIVANPK